MKFYTNGRYLQQNTAQVIDVFNNILIKRRDATGKVVQQIYVPCVYGNRSRILKSIDSRSGTHKVPIIVITTNSISRDIERVHSINKGIEQQISPLSYDANINPPIAIKIEYELTIISRYHSDADEILNNFLVFFNPDIYIINPHYKIIGEHLKTSLVWDGNADFEYPTEVNETDIARIIVNCNFTHRTWAFAGDEIDQSDYDGKYIHRINDNNLLVNPYGPNGDGGAYGVIQDVSGNWLDKDGNIINPYDYATMDKWFDVMPLSSSFDDFQTKVEAGLVKADRDRNNWDHPWSISGRV